MPLKGVLPVIFPLQLKAGTGQVHQRVSGGGKALRNGNPQVRHTITGRKYQLVIEGDYFDGTKVLRQKEFRRSVASNREG